MIYKSVKTIVLEPPTLQVLHDAPQTVSVSSDEHSLPPLDLRGDLVVPEGQCSCDGVLQALTGRKLVVSQVGVAAILHRKVCQTSHEAECKRQLCAHLYRPNKGGTGSFLPFRV